MTAAYYTRVSIWITLRLFKNFNVVLVLWVACLFSGSSFVDTCLPGLFSRGVPCFLHSLFPPFPFLCVLSMPSQW